jgi:hypothetical protein
MAGSTYYRHRIIQRTPFNEVAGDLGLIRPHPHDWKLMHGGGNGIACALGRGVELDPTVRSTEVAQFIRCTHQYHGRQEARIWVETALDDHHSKALYDWIHTTAFPQSGFSSATDYEEWRRRADPKWPEFVRWNLDRWPEHARSNPADEPEPMRHRRVPKPTTTSNRLERDL